MALKLYDDRFLTVSVRHVEVKPNGSFQYRRRIPVCLKGHYPGKAFYVRSLGRDAHELARKAADLTGKLDGLWARLRADTGVLGSSRLRARRRQDVVGGLQTALQVLVGDLGARRAAEASRNADTCGHITAGPAPRAGEIIGLRVQDVVLDHAVPHVRTKPFGTVRTLKTDASLRDIPLVGWPFGARDGRWQPRGLEAMAVGCSLATPSAGR